MSCSRNLFLPHVDVYFHSVAFELPFPDNSFDYVRMANLVLCIPYEKWDDVLTEVHRVLTASGRLELIDDQIFFPYGTAPKPLTPSWSRDMFDPFDDTDFNEDNETLQGSGSDTGSTLNASEPSSSSCEERPNQIAESPTLRPIASYQPPTLVERTFFPSPDSTHVTESRNVSWHNQAAAARELESIFEIMLKQKYKIFPRPSDFVLNRMERVFGSDAAGKTRSFHIKLAPVDSADVTPRQAKADGEETVNSKSNGVAGHFDGFSMKKKAWMGMDREKTSKKEKKLKKANPMTSNADASTGSGSGSSSERSSLENPASVPCPSAFTSSPLPPSTSIPLQPDPTQAPILSAKAAGRLGISYSDLAAASAASTQRRPGTSPSPSSPLQSPGLLVWPSTYIPLTPAELEMHANKYVHTLLGCKPALTEFIGQFVNEDGTRFVDADEFHEVMWKYEWYVFSYLCRCCKYLPSQNPPLILFSIFFSSFRRSRFNWPSEVPDLYDDELTTVPSTPISVSAPLLLKSKSGSKSKKISSDSSHNGLYYGEELTHIRTIRVFEATKADDRSLASLLFHHKTHHKTP